MEVTRADPAELLHSEAQVRFHPFYLRSPRQREGEWRVGLEKTTLAIELPVEGVKAMQALQSGQTLAETAELLLQEYGEAIDLADLVQTLAELGMVARIDTIQFALPERVGQRWLERISPDLVGWIYSRVSLVIFMALLITGPLLLVLVPALRPRAQDLLWASSYTLDLLMLLILGPLLLLKHELGHLLAARAKGLPAELTFGHRLFYLVSVSRIGEIWKCSRRERVLIYCAGMLNDGVTASCCLLLLFAASIHILLLSSSLLSLLRFIVLSEYLGIAWQFQVFMKTDVYHLLADLTGRHDLPEQAATFLRSWWRAVWPIRLRRVSGQDIASPVDPLLPGYTALSIIGISASCIWLFFYALPAMLIAWQGEIMLLWRSIPARNLLALCDGAVALCLQLLWLFLLCWSIIRKWRRQGAIRAGAATLHL